MGNCQFKSESEQDNIKSKFLFKIITLLLQIIWFSIFLSKYIKQLTLKQNWMILSNGYYYYSKNDIGIKKIKS